MSNNFRAFEFGIRIAGGFATDPVTGKLGEFYVNTVSNLPKFYNGTIWLDIIKNEFLDTEFRIYDNGDISKKIAFEAAGIATATTRTITMPDNDVNLGNMVSKAASSIDNAVVRFDGVTGDLIQNSGVIIDDSNNLSGAASVTISSSDGTTALLATKTGTNGIAGSFIITNNSNISNILELSTANSTGNHLSTPNSSTLQTEDLRIRSGKQTGTGGAALPSGSLRIGSGDSSESNSGSSYLFTGTAPFTGGLSGGLQVYTGDANAATGLIQIKTGISTTGNSGGITISSGAGVNTGTLNLFTSGAVGISGGVVIQTGAGTASGAISGSVQVGTGNTVNANSGAFAFITGTVAATGGNSGLMSFITGNSVDVSGDITFQVGNASAGSTGSFTVLIGTATNVGGNINLSAGIGGTGSGGEIFLAGGDSTSGNGGAIDLTAGSSTSGNGASVNIASGSGVVGGNTLITAGDGTSTTGGNVQIVAGSGATINGSVIAVADAFKRRSNIVANAIEESYLHSITLTGGATAVASALTFNHGSFNGVEITYTIFDSTTSFTRLGTLRVTVSNSIASFTDTYDENGATGVVWSVAINGANLEYTYSASAGNKTMRADIKRFAV